MQSIKKQIFSFFVFIIFVVTGTAQSVEKELDQLLSAEYKAGEPGVAALIAKNGKVIYRKAFGNADMELNVSMTPENVFELGSITKQFTAVAILMLQEQGKLNLDDELIKFIPDYPVKGKKITVHQLLNHTSGIKSYTDMENFQKLARTDMTPLELIDVFKNEPMDFDPGEKWNYSNSGYILLGYIIEKVTGQSYASFIENNIFKKLRMLHSYYGSKTAIISNRAHGYQTTKDGYEIADYLSMSLPYAAGSLMSTVDDMLLWSEAIHNNTLITEKSKQKAFANYSLNDGKPDYYGYGWQPNEINGVATIEHSGGIFGYTTMGVYAPTENLYAIVLTNCSGKSPTPVTIKMVAIALGKPYAQKQVISLTTDQLKKWVGTYEFAEGVLRIISYEDGSLYSQREGGTKLKLIATAASSFTFEGTTTQYEFAEENGKRIVLMKDRIQKFAGVETDRKPVPEKKLLELDAADLKKYIGIYELQKGFEIEITTAGKQIFAQATGQSKFEIYPEKEDTFFLKVVEASIDFAKDSLGKVISLTLHQGGRDMPGKKIK